MKNTLVWISLVLVSLCTGCAVISKDVTREALAERPLEEMVKQTEQLMGQTLVLGGYIVSVENQKSHTRLVVVHAPLGVGQRPKSKDLSKGRLIVMNDGFLDPEVYAKDRVVTIGGQVLGSSKTENSALPYPYLRIKAREIHLWSLEEPMSADPYWYNDCYPYHYPRWWRHRHPWCW